MVDFSLWLGGGNLPANIAQIRAARAWRRINDKPTSVAFKPLTGSLLAAQTVRIESASSVSLDQSAAGNAPVRRVVVFGIRGHATLGDTNVEEGYRFIYAGDWYEVTDIILTHGEVQAICTGS